MARLLELRNKELSEFNYIASHDLQEPLRTVINYVHVINEDYGPTLNAEVPKLPEHGRKSGGAYEYAYTGFAALFAIG
jgi:light-regulated signal transduction histidine kinase (bacteriophytochrome)